ncbi:unnamed protein product [Diatraea saccharalis]|uniref:Vacuolar protein sorting-associated protein 8 homolog n=1 Tax=Diatraea saccharalis TaxID=40085 RepID=A0A9N9WGD3_9NEOP|nr:unnamed protein product [Diatraea saccharalis]
MDLLKTPSVQSLLDSDLESVESLQYLDIEELDEVEYALPPSYAPTLAEVLSTDEEEGGISEAIKNKELFSCSTLQVDFLQAVSQQLTHAQERSSAGTATSLSVGTGGKLTVGTAHGQLLSFFDQTLRWVCDSNVDKGAVSCLAYNQDSTRLLAGYAQGLICQYESIRGILLRRVTLGGDIWGILRVTWAGTSGLALDTGGSVWLIKFSRPLGVRAARTSCLFSGARGEVVAMTAQDARVLALATLSRVIIVAGGRAAGVRLGGPPDTLPVLEWCETDDRILVCGRAKTLQWLSVTVTGTSISLRSLQRVELKTTPLWLGWLGGNLAIFDANENIRLWGEDYDKPLDLSHVEPVYASAFFKGLFTDGRVSRAMCKAGVSALGGVCVVEGTLSLLGRRGIVRVRPRDLITRTKTLLSSGHHLQVLRILCSCHGTEAKSLANQLIVNISERPHLLSNRNMAEQIIKLCLKFNLSQELWTTLWEHCSNENAFVEALGDAAVRGDFTTNPPSPDATQALIERLAEFEPGLVERVVASLPLTALDPHRASVFTREKKLWRGVGAIAAALGGSSGAMRELAPHVRAGCGGAGGAGCGCAGDALVLAAADALAGRGAAGRPLPDHARPSARHDALHALLDPDVRCEGRSPLHVLVMHDASAAVRLLEQSAREPPFAGPLAKQNRLRVARALLALAPELQASCENKARTEILEFVSGQISSGALPSDHEVLKATQELAAATDGERADRAWLTLIARDRQHPDRLQEQRDLAAHRPRVAWKIDSTLNRHDDALHNFFRIDNPSPTDVDELFEYIQSKIEANGIEIDLKPHLPALIELRPGAAAAVLPDRYSNEVEALLEKTTSEKSLEFAENLLEKGQLRGDAAAAYFKALCTLRPTAAVGFLAKYPGVVRPERALAIVRETGATDAEAVCSEAAGDPSGALDSILRRLDAGNEKEVAAAVVEAAELCARVAPGAPPAVAEEMWTRLLGRAPSVPPSVILEAAAYVPAETLIARAGKCPRGVSALLSCAASGRRAWWCGARVAGREAHEAVARALAAARRGLSVRGRCTGCGLRLAACPPVVTTHCARARHLDCGQEITCTCGRRVPDVVWSPPQRTRRSLSPPREHDLQLVAPPRPDLEGIV